ncbi:MAG TPA: NAD(P)/FAD-dependent oxidoreductase [Solirubrobacteraceae bacterium]|jgi:cation diffusion facilitator CzcD-associated flavoprotein CzcO
MPPASATDVAVIGAGFSGIGAAIALQRAGFEDLVILEAGDGVGGAWYWNAYPGIAVDIPSFSYQFSYAQRDDWSRVYAPGRELRAYAEDLVDRYGLRPRIRLGTAVTGAEWDEAARVWRLAIEDGSTVTARWVVGATGVLTKPKPPDIPGVEGFTGVTMHTARWDPSVALRGKRVAIVGTGASAVQVVPAIAPEVAELTVFQRTPIWCLPKPDGRMPRAVRGALRHVPGAGRALRVASQAYVELLFPVAAHYAGVVPMTAVAERVARGVLEREVHDPAVRAKLTPDYAVGCKRPGFSNDYLRTFNRADVHLETAPIEAVAGAMIRTAAGERGPFDVLVLATGFKVFEPGNMPPFGVTGAGGADLEAFWSANRYQAYEGVSVPGFPNFFAILGPYGFNGASYFTLIENQSRHIVRCLRHARRVGATRVEVTREANDRYWAEMLGRRHRQVFFQGRCGTSRSYYFDAHGDVPFRASTTLEAMWRSARYPLRDYAFSGAPAPAPA